MTCFVDQRMIDDQTRHQWRRSDGRCLHFEPPTACFLVYLEFPSHMWDLAYLGHQTKMKKGEGREGRETGVDTQHRNT